MNILLKNEFGRANGNYIVYEYGQDLFGYYYLDIVRSKKHCAEKIESHLFEKPSEFICILDEHLYRRERLHYFPVDPVDLSKNSKTS